MPDAPPSVLLAGGGTGGHIYPNVGIVERLRTLTDAPIRFLVSNRSGDAAIMDKLGWPYTASPIRPLPGPRRPQAFLPFARSWRAGMTQLRRILVEDRVGAVVATGGFVSGPAIVAALRHGVPRALVNLDAVPGIANRGLARWSSHVFTAATTPLLPGAELVGLPLREVSIGTEPPDEARRRLGLAPDLPTLFITGATHGAESIIRAMMAILADERRAARMRGWQVLHQCGTFDVAQVQSAYDRAGVSARAVDYLDRMGRAYAAADLVLGRSGAGSVAEAWANGRPTIFLPNPYHKDQHQRLNAEPMVDIGAARIVADRIEPSANVDPVCTVLFELMEDEVARRRMAEAATTHRPADGATRVAQWLAAQLQR